MAERVTNRNPLAKPLASLGRSKKSLNILGEFSVAGKTCRLIEVDGHGSSKKLVLVACKKDDGDWESDQHHCMRLQDLIR
ncbi:MAG: hypothetical protein CFH03_01900 [Alphaproteobacteria bacterium MarineAlpha3_Bin2]|nr:MAG: hypothetical protein CFH02_00753 [Alphaproteobacteria bacterium MarineAlpha3_Bin1]PPR71725.1 MAG: hypothetical protein CFH03_01900 [Alphaproteobacteria bacterium MarineAlpha3_Bin2]